MQILQISETVAISGLYARLRRSCCFLVHFYPFCIDCSRALFFLSPVWFFVEDVCFGLCLNFRCRGEAERVVHVQTLTLASEQWRDSALALEGLIIHGAHLTLMFLGFKVLGF